jgi:hypothetical protein
MAVSPRLVQDHYSVQNPRAAAGLRLAAGQVAKEDRRLENQPSANRLLVNQQAAEPSMDLRTGVGHLTVVPIEVAQIEVDLIENDLPVRRVRREANPLAVVQRAEVPSAGVPLVESRQAEGRRAGEDQLAADLQEVVHLEDARLEEADSNRNSQSLIPPR